MPLVTVLTKQWTSMLRVIGLAVMSVIVPINQVFALSYGVTAGIARPTMITIGLVGSVAVHRHPAPVRDPRRPDRSQARLHHRRRDRRRRHLPVLRRTVHRVHAGRRHRHGADDVHRLRRCATRSPRPCTPRCSTPGSATPVSRSPGQLGQIFPGFAPAIAAAIIAAGGGGTQVSLFVAICCALQHPGHPDRPGDQEREHRPARRPSIGKHGWPGCRRRRLEEAAKVAR